MIKRSREDTIEMIYDTCDGLYPNGSCTCRKIGNGIYCRKLMDNVFNCYSAEEAIEQEKSRINGETISAKSCKGKWYSTNQKGF